MLLALAGFAQGQDSPATPASSAGHGGPVDEGSQTTAQASSSLRAVNGTVYDPSGAAIVGARIRLVSADGKLVAETTSDHSGAFVFDKLTPGTYHLDVQVQGFEESRTSVTVGKRSVTPVRITLSIAGRKEVVTVQSNDTSAQVTTELSQNQSANTVDRNALDRLPVFDQDYIATVSRFLDDSAIGTNGVSLVVNGVEANGPGVTASAIQEVRINQNPYSALFARPGRARLEIITKGGTSQLHGEVNFMFRDSVFDAANAFAVEKPPEQRRYFEGSLTGPISRGRKTTFLMSLDEDQEDLESIVVAQGVNGPINENVSQPMRHFFGSWRVFREIGTADQFWIGYSYERQTIKNQCVGGTQLLGSGISGQCLDATVLPEARANLEFQEHEVNVSYRRVVSTRWINQLRFLVGHYDASTKSLNPDPQIVVSGAFTGGGAQADARRTEYHFDGNDTVTYATPKHTVNFGIDIPDISRRGFDDFTNAAGTYTFGSLSDYEQGKPSTYLVQRGQGHLVFLEKVLSGFIEDNIRVQPNFSVQVGLRYYWQNYFHDDPNNLAPRLALTYAPGKNGKTVFRAGAGVFYDRTGPRPISDLLHFNGVNLLRFILDNPPFPVTPASLAGVPTSVVVLDPNARIPYTIQYSIGAERQVTANSTFSATYVGSRGIDLFRSIDANAPPPPEFPMRPNPALGQEREIQSNGYQKSNALELTFRGKPSNYFSGQVQYTFSKTYNNTSGISYFPANSFDPAADWALADTDRRHKFDLMGVTQAGTLFTFGVALSAYSGRPVNITTGSDNNHDGIINDRPAGVARNTMPGPALINLDVNAAHDFVLSKKRKEGPTLTVALNAFNVLNHVNDVTYIGVVTSPFFGHAVAAQPARRLQLNLRLKF